MRDTVGESRCTPAVASDAPLRPTPRESLTSPLVTLDPRTPVLVGSGQTLHRAEGIDDSIAKRDRIDSSRKVSPLVVSGDALVVDSSHLTAEEVVATVLAAIRERMGE